ncbi:MAG: PilZ domain-containing protein [Acidobacteriota bacterium]
MLDIWKVKRTEPRISLTIPVSVEGVDLSGQSFLDETITENVSRNGACLILERDLKIGLTLVVTANEGKFKSEATVRGVWIDEKDGRTKVGVQFTPPVRNWVIS